MVTVPPFLWTALISLDAWVELGLPDAELVEGLAVLLDEHAATRSPTATATAAILICLIIFAFAR
jgi:hypothetical protein